MAGGDELLQAQRVEVEREIAEEITLERVVAIAENRLAAKLIPIMPQLIFYIDKLRIKFVILVFFSL